jgi:16S rRNA (cytidine1402-2'-O)-methyltransferase
VTIVVSGAVPVAAVADDPDALRTSVAELEEEGMSRKDAIVETARLAGVPKRRVYNLVHEA